VIITALVITEVAMGRHPIRTAYAQAGYFPAARRVVWNPQTRAQRGAAQGTLLTSEPAKDVAELFNEAYACAAAHLAAIRRIRR
jgi:hypothetical protein